MASNLNTVLTFVGVLAGYLSFIRLLSGDIGGWYKRPRLKIEFDPAEDLREWTLLGTGRLQKVATVHVRNTRKVPALRCVAVLRLISAPPNVENQQKEFVLHWADTDYSAHTSVAEPVEIGFERRRLDVAFTFVAAAQSSRGTWVAIPIALFGTAAAPQAHLEPGEYRFRLFVECANGKGAARDFLIISPEDWRDLSMRVAQ